jgi:hypothetical protein
VHEGGEHLLGQDGCGVLGLVLVDFEQQLVVDRGDQRAGQRPATRTMASRNRSLAEDCTL